MLWRLQPKDLASRLKSSEESLVSLLAVGNISLSESKARTGNLKVESLLLGASRFTSNPHSTFCQILAKFSLIFYERALI